MSTPHKHSIVQLFIILSSALLIIGELQRGEVAERWNMAAYITIGIELICWPLLRKRLTKDPLRKLHRLLDIVCIILTTGLLLFKCIDLLSAHHTSTTILAVVGIVTLATIHISIICSIKKESN